MEDAMGMCVRVCVLFISFPNGILDFYDDFSAWESFEYIVQGTCRLHTTTDLL